MKYILLFFIFISPALQAQAQPAPFAKEIAAFRHKDSVQMPARNSILFVGSSSFTKWTDIADYFPGYPVINRGFGGSCLTDLIYYIKDVVYPYHPKQIFIYCGENDFAGSDTLSPQTVAGRFATFLAGIRKMYPKIPVDYLSIKPSPSRWKWEHKFVEANRLIKAYIGHQPHTRYIDIHSAMLEPDGTVKQDIFIQDKLHMNAKGYHIWQGILQPYLLK